MNVCLFDVLFSQIHSASVLCVRDDNTIHECNFDFRPIRVKANRRFVLSDYLSVICEFFLVLGRNFDGCLAIV